MDDCPKVKLGMRILVSFVNSKLYQVLRFSLSGKKRKERPTKTGMPSNSKEDGSATNSSGSASSSIWFIAIVIVCGSFCLTLVQLSKGLHEQLVVTKEQLLEAHKALVDLEVEKETLLEQHRQEGIRVAKLRDKSALVSKELLDQNKQTRLLKYEVLASRNDLKSITHNCTESSRLMEKQFNVTMRFLMDRVINNREYQIMLDRNLEERVLLERSVELLQNKVYNLTDQLTQAKSALFKAGKSLKECKSDVDTLKERLLESNDALKKSLDKLERLESASQQQQQNTR